MVIIIDGYNLLKYLFPGLKRNLAEQKKTLLKQLAYYKAHKSTSLTDIIIVFDAGPSTHALRSIEMGVIIVYSGTKMSADDWIIDFVRRNQVKQIVVVTHDRALANTCESLDACNMASQDFYTILQQCLATQIMTQKEQSTPNPEIEKYENQHGIALAENHDTAQGLDLLMEQATQYMAHKDEDSKAKSLPRSKKSFKLSKREKLFQSIIKKLT